MGVMSVTVITTIITTITTQQKAKAAASYMQTKRVCPAIQTPTPNHSRGQEGNNMQQAAILAV
jgi:hypothetical protein